MSLRVVLLLVLLPIAVIAQTPARPGPPPPPGPPRPAGAPAQDPAAPAGKGIIRGVVTAADTGRPIQRAEIRLSSSGLVPPDSRTVLTDEKGRFEATALRAGRYTVSASKPGYLNLAYGQMRPRESGRPVELSETTPLDKIDFVLPRASVIVAR